MKLKNNMNALHRRLSGNFPESFFHAERKAGNV